MFDKLSNTTYEILRWSRALISMIEAAAHIMENEENPYQGIQEMLTQLELDTCPDWVWSKLREYFPDLMDEFNELYACVSDGNE